MEEIAEELATYFLVKDYKWKFNFGLINPDSDDMLRALNRMVVILEEQDGDAQFEMGHLLLKKRAGVIDIFVHANTIGEKNDD